MTYPDRYDAAIQHNMQVYLSDVDWRWGKAQLIAESNLNPNAESPVGALGLAQFMRDTWDLDVCQHFGWDPDECFRTDEGYAIPAFAWYMRRLWDAWKAPRPVLDRLRLTQASYNAGLGSVIRAQRLARATGSMPAPNDYASIIAALPQVTGGHAQETIGYVERIAAIYERLASPLQEAASAVHSPG